ncbi:MAG TPA: rod shape-determining protein MreD [Nocardioides sp.]|nr:rod shape-determining protein MreD [Nocardioides sp.]
MRDSSRLVAALAATVTALLLQVTVMPHLAYDGVVADLVLLVVVAAALVTDARFATLLGFGAGLLLDLAPPGDHVAGRWALALMVVGYVVGRLAHDHPSVADRRPALPVMLAAAAGGSFVGSSVFALTGVLLSDPSVPFADQLGVVLTALALDAVVALVVVPLTVWLFTRRSGPPPTQVTPRLPLPARRTVVR